MKKIKINKNVTDTYEVKDVAKELARYKHRKERIITAQESLARELEKSDSIIQQLQ